MLPSSFCALACCLSCRGRIPQVSPYCVTCGQRLWPPEVLSDYEVQSCEKHLRFNLSGPGIVYDRQTGLTWQQGGSPKPLAQAAAGSYLDDINRRKWGERQDWRLPTLPELASLLASRKNAHGLYLAPLFGGRQPVCWSATISPTGGAYGVLFYPGTIQAQDRNRPAFIRAVAGESREELPECNSSHQLIQEGRDILFSEGQRRVPRQAEIENFLTAGGLLSEVVLGGSQQFYFLPTEEFFQALIRLFHRLGVTRVVEVGAWEGFCAAALTDRGFPVVATDVAPPCCSWPYGVQVFRASHLEAMVDFQPELVFWCWPPLGSRAPAEILATPGLRYYLEIGDGGFATGEPSLAARFRGRYLKTLSSLGYTWLDVGPYRHNRVFLFKRAETNQITKSRF